MKSQEPADTTTMARLNGSRQITWTLLMSAPSQEKEKLSSRIGKKTTIQHF
jgi:hypothetical protein